MKYAREHRWVDWVPLVGFLTVPYRAFPHEISDREAFLDCAALTYQALTVAAGMGYMVLR